MRSRILIADDEKLKLVTLHDALTKRGYQVEECEDGESAWACMERGRYDIVVTDLRLPKVDGLELLRRIRRDYPETAVILMTAYGTIENAVEAMKIGAYDYITKPFSSDELILRIRKIEEYRALASENVRLRQELQDRFGIEEIVGASEPMQQVFSLIRAVASTDSTVIIYGESGTGKELVARAIHQCSERRDKSFVNVSCAALPESLLEDELFGHERGAFTGALSRRLGRFELANGGTVFLDDIDDMKPSIQVKLLRVLQYREFERLGGTNTLTVDVRVLAASKVDLADAVETGRFREDLYYRLNVVRLHLPPLRERKADIPLLVEHFKHKYAQRAGKDNLRLSPDALDLLIAHDWPGNVRELENAIEQAFVLSQSSLITAEAFKAIMPKRPKSRHLFPLRHLDLDGVSFSDAIQNVEKEFIQWALRQSKGNQSHAAKLLNIPRTTLTDKMHRLGISTEVVDHK